MKNELLKKEKGSAAVTGFIPLIITVILVALVAVQYAGYIKVINYKDKISMTVRKYIIRMETKGFLDSEDEEALLGELGEIGVKNIDLTGTTFSEAEYGEIIYLCVKGDLYVEVYNITDIFTAGWGSEVIEINELKTSTSQQ